jgi:hypothetical protein
MPVLAARCFRSLFNVIGHCLLSMGRGSTLEGCRTRPHSQLPTLIKVGWFHCKPLSSKVPFSLDQFLHSPGVLVRTVLAAIVLGSGGITSPSQAQDTTRVADTAYADTAYMRGGETYQVTRARLFTQQERKQAEAAATVQMQAAVSSFLGSLPEDDQEILASDRTLDDDFWAEYLAVKDTFALADYRDSRLFGDDPPEITPLLRRPMYINGQEVAEARNKRANKRIMLSACKDGKPIIYYSQRLGAQTSPYSLVFFRLHEAAHFQLGHVVCDGATSLSDYPTAPKQEEVADCWARDTLFLSTTGNRIIGSAYERLFQMNDPAKAPYPASRARATMITGVCPRE